MDTARLWESLLEAMRQRIGHQAMEIWLRGPLKPLNFDGQNFVLRCENSYYADWIRENYQVEMNEEASRLSGTSVHIRLQCSDAEASESSSSSATSRLDANVERAVGLNTHQTFDNFVIGECNRFAQAAAQAVAERPAQAYTPLFIYGSTGLGKTHLMHAIGNYVHRHDANSRIVYVTAEAFMNEMIQCLRFRRMEDFRAKYRKRATLLLVDDVQFLSGRDRTQEEFFHTFNALQAAGRQVVLSSDKTPSEIDKLEPRLRTRFQGGLLADMQAPDKETLIAILYDKVERLGLQIPSAVADVIASGVGGNIRELEGVINKLSAKYSFYREPISVAFLRKELPDLFQPNNGTLTVAGIIEAVARMHNLRSADITGSRRTRSLAQPRHIAMYLARRHTSLSFPDLGREFGDRDHSTVQYGVKKLEKEVKNNPDLAYKISLIEQSLNIRG